MTERDPPPGHAPAPATSPARPLADPFARLRSSTPARIGLGRFGHGLPTSAMLDFQLAHARARDAVHASFAPESVAAALGERPSVIVHSLASDRQSYLQRPDLGRQLRQADAARLATGNHAAGELDARSRATASQVATDQTAVTCEIAFVIADGLSAPAVHSHAVPLLHALFPKLNDWRIAPIVIACQARVALGDEIGACLGAALVAVLIGERPGLSAPDSLGVYLTWHPRPGRQDNERNCISNIRPPTGLSYDQAASRLAWLLTAARRQKLTGVGLKDSSATPVAAPSGLILARSEPVR
jgi:ethanolamine ammonia-lyase small subunit